MSLINKVDQFNDDVDIAHQIVHGDSTTIVTTEGGPVRSLAKLIADKDAEFIGGNVVQQAVAALNATESAMDTAILARDAAMVGAVTYPDEATGRAAVADGEYFKVIGSGDVAAREYRRTDASTSVLVAEYPSAGLVNSIATQTYDQNEFLYSGYIHVSTGDLSAGSTYRSTNFLPVEGGAEYKVITNTPGSSACAWYDKNKNFISSFKGAWPSPTNVVAPENALYLRMSCPLSTITAAVGATTVGGSYNLDKLSSALRIASVSIDSSNITMDGEILSDTLDRFEDPMTSTITVKTVDERNNITSYGTPNRAWPPGLRAYDEGLRSEVIADGIWWRLPDGTPADVAERTDVYPGFDEVISNLATYATAHSVVSDFSDMSKWSSSNQRITFSRSGIKGFPALKLEYPVSGFVRYQASTPLNINRFLLLKLFVQDFSEFYMSRIYFINSVGTRLYYTGLASAANTGPNAAPLSPLKELLDLEIDIQIMVKTIPEATMEDVTGIEIYFGLHANKSATVWLGEIRSASFRPCITLRFDDPRLSLYTNGFPKMQEYGFPGMAAIITNSIGDGIHCTEEQILDMQSNGWDLVAHTHNHIDAGVSDYETLDFEFKECKRILKSLGSPLTARSCYVAPYARWSELSEKVYYKYYDCNHRGNHINSCVGRRPKGGMGSGSWSRMGSINGDRSTAAQLIDATQTVIDQQGWGIILIHEILPTFNTYGILKEDFDIYVTWLHENRDKVDVVSFSQMVNRMRGST